MQSGDRFGGRRLDRVRYRDDRGKLPVYRGVKWGFTSLPQLSSDSCGITKINALLFHQTICAHKHLAALYHGAHPIAGDRIKGFHVGQ